MATKKFIIEECTNEECCKDCKDKTAWCFQLCERYIPNNNLATMRIKGTISYEELQEFANQYSHNIWEQLMQRFKADDKFYIGANDVSDYVLNAILDTYKMMEENNESKSY